jgi:hypothetical protein
MRPRKPVEKIEPANLSIQLNPSASPTTVPDPIPGNGTGVASSPSCLPEQEVDFAELEDGTLVEMIEDPNDPANSLLAIYKNGTVQIAPKVECENRVLVPLPRNKGIFKHVRLPRGSQPHEPAHLLLGGIAGLILACVDMSRDKAFLVAAFVLSTWFVESLSVAPYVALVGLPRSGRGEFMNVKNLRWISNRIKASHRN